MSDRRGNANRQRGLTLTEMMVALAVGLFIMGAVVQMFLGSRQISRTQEALSRIQENGRFALEILARDIRAAGFLGCQSNLAPETPRGNGALGSGLLRNTLNPEPPAPPAVTLNLSVPFQGYNAVEVAESGDSTRRRLPPIHAGDEGTATSTSWSPNLPSEIINTLSQQIPPVQIRGERDVFTVIGAESRGSLVTDHPGGNPPGSADIKVEPNSGFEDDDILLVSDCESGAVFQATQVNENALSFDNIVHNTGNPTDGPGNWTKALGKSYVGGEVFRITSTTYFVGTGASGLPALFRLNRGSAQELVEGVRDMQIVYGIDTDGDRIADQYVEAAAGWAPGQVVSARVTLLVVSPENNVVDESVELFYSGATYDFADEEYEIGGQPDRHLYQVFTTTVGLRNRLP